MKFVTALLLILSSVCWSAQEDLSVVLRSPFSLYKNNAENKIGFLSDFNLRTGFGGYFVAGANQAWQFKSHGSVAVMSFGKDGVWRIDFDIQGNADNQNTIGFRIAQSLYEFSTAVEWRLGTGVIYGGYRHRCKHGADNTPTRIIMRTGPEIGYNWLHEIGPFQIIWNNHLNVFVAGQNKDTSYLPRGFAGTAAQLNYQTPISWLKLFTSAGLGMMIVGDTPWQDTGGFNPDGTCKEANGNGCGEYTLVTPVNYLYLNWIPAAALGVQFVGGIGDLRLFTSFHSNLDSGLTGSRHRDNVVSLNFEFVL